MSRQRSTETFADLVRKASSAPRSQEAQLEPWPRPIRARRWTDADGKEWRLRGHGGGMAWSDVDRMLSEPGVRVLHAYGPDPQELVGEELSALLDRFKEFCDHHVPPHSDFVVGEFRDDERNILIVIEEAC